MKVLLFRHAEKANDGTANPPLSREGLNQARRLVEEVSAKKLPKPKALLSSPRLRAQQTFKELSLGTGIPVQVNPLLNERAPTESPLDFRRRVQEFLVSFQLDFNSEDCVYLCSHLDWIEEFLTIIESPTDFSAPQYSHWSSAQWMMLEKDEIWEVLKIDRVRI